MYVGNLFMLKILFTDVLNTPSITIFYHIPAHKAGNEEYIASARDRIGDLDVGRRMWWPPHQES